MLRKTCAHNDLPALPGNHSEKNTLCERILFLIFALILFVPLFTVPALAAVAASNSSPKNGMVAPSFPKATTQIVVNIIVNTEKKGDFFAELDDRGNLFITVEDAKALKLQYAENKIVIIRGDEQFVPMNALLDVTCTFDEKKLTLSIIGKTTESGKTAADLFSLQNTARNIYYPRETSAFLNYGLSYAYTSDDGFQSFGLTNKLGLRTGDVFFTSDSLYTRTENSDKFVRLQSSATYERRGDLQWLVFGDQYANSGDLGSTVNIGGIGFSKVYRLDPYFITQPVMDLKGSVIFPTQAEIYLDGVLIGKQFIAPGSFDLKNLYSYTGSHNVEVLLKDPFGNVQKISYLAYFSTQLLRKGLHEYSYNAGFLRDQYGMESNDYGEPAFSVFHRYGVTNSLNIGARAEGSDGVYNGGASIAFLVPKAGSFTMTLAGSSAKDNATGGAVSLQHSYQIGSLSTNLLLRAYSRDYATVATPYSEDMTQYEVNFGLGFLLNPLGSFALSYSERNNFNNNVTRVFSSNYSRVLYKSISMFATGSVTSTTGSDTNYSGFVGLNFELGKDLRGSAQVSSSSGGTNSETLQLQKDIPVGEGLGYRASLNRTETASNTTTVLNPYVQYNARHGIYSLDVSLKDSEGTGSEIYNLSAAGSLVYAGGFYGLSRPVSDSFGMVMVNEVPGATVLNNGQNMGKTDSSGNLIVPTLSSYGRNQITLDTKDIPMDYSISEVNKILSPSLWSGSCIAFDAHQVRALTGNLVMQQEGKTMPLEYVEISMKVGEKILAYPTGKGGEFYVENSLPEEREENLTENMSCRAVAEQRKSGGKVIRPGTYPASVELKEGKCAFMLTFPETKDTITDLGEIHCVIAQSSMSRPAGTPSPALKDAVPASPPVPASSLLSGKFYQEEDTEISGPSVPAPTLSVRETPSAGALLPAPKNAVSTADEKKRENFSIALHVEFDTKKVVIRKKYHDEIKKIADYMKEHPEIKIVINGHTDDVDIYHEPETNEQLSRARAESVRRYLIKFFGIDGSRITTVGHSLRKPIASNATKEGRQKNRRAEIVIDVIRIK